MRNKLRLTLCLLILTNIFNIAHAQSSNKKQDVYSLMMSRIQTDTERGINIKKIADKIPIHLQTYNAGEGSFTDIAYQKDDRTNWPPLEHIYRLHDLVLVYTMPGNAYYQDETTYQQLVQGLQYWYNINPRCHNWWYNQIAEPQRLGVILIQMRKGKQQLPATLEHITLERMRTDGGNPHAQTGPNKTDIAIHWLYRACLTQDAQLMQTTMQQAYEPLQIVSQKEGIQHDNSYFQHGQQLYIAGYGDELIKGTLMFANYSVGTQFAIDKDKLALFSKFVRHSYYKIIRGSYLHYNTMGRGMSRIDNTRRDAQFAQQLITVDPLHAQEYKDIVKRINAEEPASYRIKPNNTTYYIADYMIHTRPQYAFGVRTVSNRTLRNEYGNGENLDTYFLSDGSTHITQSGDEYFNIFPVWDWAHIPGVTNPHYDTIPKAKSDWKTQGTSSFVGGVSDSLYSANTYALTDYHVGIDTEARKAWFCFDNEVVCLGAGIKSQSKHPVHTTVQQSLLQSPVIFSSKNTIQTIGKEHISFDADLEWVLHNKVGYVFRQGAQIVLRAEERTGDWNRINNSTPSEIVSKDVFSLWINHGYKPQNEQYAYIVLPNQMDEDKMKKYDDHNIEIIANTPQMQVVHNKKLNIWQMIFYEAGSFVHQNLSVSVDKGAAIMLKGVGTDAITMHIADPAQRQETIRVELSANNSTTLTTCNFEHMGVHAGKSRMYRIQSSVSDK